MKKLNRVLVIVMAVMMMFSGFSMTVSATEVNEELKTAVIAALEDGSGYSEHRLFYKVNVNRLVKFTIEELRDVLEVVDHDWVEQAKMTVNTAYLSKGEGYSRFKLIENLSFDGEPYSYGYTHEDAVQAVDEMGIDFFAEAVLRAQYLKDTPEPGYIAHGDMVCFHRFTHEQTNAAMIEVYGQLGLTPSIVIEDKIITYGEITTLVAETRGHSYDPWPCDYQFNFKWTNITTGEVLKDGISGFREGYPHIGRDTLEVAPTEDTTYRIDVVDVCGFNINKEVKVTVKPVITEEEIIETVEIPFDTIYEDDPTLELGEEVVKIEGVIGIETITIKVTTTNGIESREEISRVEDPVKVDKVILRGTKKPVVDPVDPEPILTLEKLVKEDSFSQAGDELNYSFAITNTGELPLVKLTVNDPKLGIVDLEIDLTLTPLALGETYTHVFNAPYIVTEADVAANGPITNVLTVIAETEAGSTAEFEADVTVPFEQVAPFIPPILTLEKLVKEDSFSQAGDELHYSFTVKNEGIMPVVKLTVNDPKLGIEDLIIDLTDDPIMPGETYTYTFNQAYVVSAADVEAGKVENELTVISETPEGATIELTDSVTVPMERVLPHIPKTGEHHYYHTSLIALVLGGAFVIMLIKRRQQLRQD